MLSFDNVTKSYRLDDNNTIFPVRDVSLTIETGELVMIVGRSGTGKTTFLNLAAGLVKPSSGRVLVEGSDLAAMTQRQLSSLRSRKLGFIFQFPSLIPALTVMDNVCLPSIFSEKAVAAGSNQRAVQILDTLGLAGKAGVYPRQLSAGETKRVVLARSLINQPALVLADEPTSDLDDRTEKEVMDLLRKINATGVTFLIVTHSRQLVPFASRAFEMENGALTRIREASNVQA
jgi:ABC-type lipoprotein export system ATPase subunit